MVGPSSRNLAIFVAYATIAVIVVMTIVTLATGANQEVHEHFAAPDAYAAALLAKAAPLRLLFGLDVAFTVVYASFFTLFATYLRGRGAAAALIWIALGAALATAALDLVEDQHILAMLDSAEHGITPSASAIAWQVAQSGVKFSVSFFALFAFGLAIPRTNLLGTGLALILTVGSLINAVIAYAVPVTTPLGIEVGRWVGFVVAFVLAIAWLRREPD
jgi:hypothetical protein